MDVVAIDRSMKSMFSSWQSSVRVYLIASALPFPVRFGKLNIFSSTVSYFDEITSALVGIGAELVEELVAKSSLVLKVV